MEQKSKEGFEKHLVKNCREAIFAVLKNGAPGRWEDGKIIRNSEVLNYEFWIGSSFDSYLPVRQAGRDG